MSTLNKSKVKSIMNKIEQLLKDNQESLGIKVEVQGCTYDEDSFKAKFNFMLPDAKPEIEKALEHYSDVYEKLDKNKVVKIDNYNFQLCGYKRKARTKPFVVCDVNTDKHYKMDRETVIKHFAI